MLVIAIIITFFSYFSLVIFGIKVLAGFSSCLTFQSVIYCLSMLLHYFTVYTKHNPILIKADSIHYESVFDIHYVDRQIECIILRIVFRHETSSQSQDY